MRLSCRFSTSRLPWWGLTAAAAWLAATASVLPARAQGQEQVDIAIRRDEGEKKTIFQSLNQFSSYGATFGVMKVMGGDLGKDTSVRPVLQGVFRYRFSDQWVGSGEFGFGWNSLSGDSVVALNFGTLGAARRVAQRLGAELRVGVGAGLYRWNYKYKGKSLRDAGTQRFYRGISPGGYLGLELERRLMKHVTLLALLQGHYVATADSEKFHYLFDENHMLTSFRLGASYHFSPYEGILWERKGAKKIRLESGREGR